MSAEQFPILPPEDDAIEQETDAIIFEFPGVRRAPEVMPAPAPPDNPLANLSAEEVGRWLRYLHTGIK